MQWYEKGNYYKKRLLREIKFIEEYKKRNPESKIEYKFWGKSKNLVVRYIYKYNGRVFGIYCTYPLLYPKTRIEARVYEYDLKKKDIVPFDEGYHNTDGVLCLLGHYPNEWSEEYGIEYIIERVNVWFAEGQYDKNNIVPINYNIDNLIFIFPEPLASETTQSYKIFEYSYIQEKACIVISTNARGKITKAETIPKSFNVKGAKVGKGIVIYTTKPLTNKIPIQFSDIKTYTNCFKHGIMGLIEFSKVNGIDFPIPVVIIFINHNFEGQSFLIKKTGDFFDIETCRFSHFRVYEDIFSRVKDREDLNYLKRKKIALVGLGSIGSSIATELARSGVANFLLIDNDKLEIQNIGRHDLTLKDIDNYKVKAVEDKILDINPKSKCSSFNWNVLDDYSYTLYNLLKCDLIISTIDEQEAKYAIDSTLVPEGKKVIYAGAFYNSVAGFVMVSDKSMGCFKCISKRMDYMAEQGNIPDFSALVPQNIEYNCGIPTFPGGSINTHTISIFAARIALDTILGMRQSDTRGYPYNLYLIGNESLKVGQDQFFKGFMDVKRFVIPGIEGCEVCDKEPIFTGEEEELYKNIMESIDR